VAIPSIRGC
jgi:hypothetical protein